MIRRIFKLNSLINRGGFVRSITGIQSLYNYTNSIKSDDEDISEEVITATRKIAKAKPESLSNTARQLIRLDPVYRLRYYLNCTETEAVKMLKENPAIEHIKKLDFDNVLDLLRKNDITIESIIENPFLLTINEAAFYAKIKIVEKFIKKKPLRTINDVVALLQVSKLVLTRASKLHEKEQEDFPNGGRIYFFSKELGVEPKVVSKYFATHMFMFGVPVEMLKTILRTLQHYNIGEKYRLIPNLL